MSDTFVAAKKIYINGRFLTRSMTGVDRFAFEILRALDKVLDDEEYADFKKEFEVNILIPGGSSSTVVFSNLILNSVGPRNQFLWEQFYLPIFTYGKFLLNLCNSAPFLKIFQLVVIHDIATFRVPSSYSWKFRLWYRFLIPALYKNSDVLCTVSNFSLKEMKQLFGERKDIVLLPEGTDHMERIVVAPSTVKSLSIDARRYIFLVSSLAPHKNFNFVLNAISSIEDRDYEVLIAGSKNNEIFSNSRFKTQSGITFLGYVSDEELKALYERAICFIFPSIYEGYGLPPTEAMSCGCPVLVSNRASLPEVCGSAALYFDPFNLDSLVSCLNTVRHDGSVRDQLIDHGRHKSLSLKWAVSAKILLGEIRKVAVR